MNNLEKFQIKKENQKKIKGGSIRDTPCKAGEEENSEGYCVPIDYDAFYPVTD